MKKLYAHDLGTKPQFEDRHINDPVDHQRHWDVFVQEEEKKFFSNPGIVQTYYKGDEIDYR